MYVSRRERRVDLTERAAGDVQIRISGAKTIRHIERFDTGFDRFCFADGEDSRKRCIPLPCGRAENVVPAPIRSERTDYRHTKCGRAQERVPRSVRLSGRVGICKKSSGELSGQVAADSRNIAAGSNDRLTEAHGYIGLDLLLKDQKDAGVTHLQWVKDHGNRTFVEYTFSTIELNRLENAKQ